MAKHPKKPLERKHTERGISEFAKAARDSAIADQIGVQRFIDQILGSKQDVPMPFEAPPLTVSYYETTHDTSSAPFGNEFKSLVFQSLDPKSPIWTTREQPAPTTILPEQHYESSMVVQPGPEVQWLENPWVGTTGQVALFPNGSSQSINAVSPTPIGVPLHNVLNTTSGTTKAVLSIVPSGIGKWKAYLVGTDANGTNLVVQQVSGYTYTDEAIIMDTDTRWLGIGIQSDALVPNVFEFRLNDHTGSPYQLTALAQATLCDNTAGSILSGQPRNTNLKVFCNRLVGHCLTRIQNQGSCFSCMVPRRQSYCKYAVQADPNLFKHSNATQRVDTIHKRTRSAHLGWYAPYIPVTTDAFNPNEAFECLPLFQGWRVAGYEGSANPSADADPQPFKYQLQYQLSWQFEPLYPGAPKESPARVDIGQLQKALSLLNTCQVDTENPLHDVVAMVYSDLKSVARFVRSHGPRAAHDIKEIAKGVGKGAAIASALASFV